MQDRLFEDLDEFIESLAIILWEHKSILVREWDQSFFFGVCCNSDSTPFPPFFVDNYWDQLVWKTQSWRR